jgi:hypothetical protein
VRTTPSPQNIRLGESGICKLNVSDTPTGPLEKLLNSISEYIWGSYTNDTGKLY